METKAIQPEVMPMVRQEAAMELVLKHNRHRASFKMSLLDKSVLIADGFIATSTNELKEYELSQFHVCIFISDVVSITYPSLEFYIHDSSIKE